jgi:type II secretory pathway pseudopilin PulG
MTRPHKRRGFTVLETLAALGALAAATVLVAEVALWSLGERSRNAARHDALECAANVLESARTLPWDDLTPEWAAGQRLPEELARRLPGGKLTVRVEPEAARPRTRRVTVEVGWDPTKDAPAGPVRLVGLFSDRSARTTGGKP